MTYTEVPQAAIAFAGSSQRRLRASMKRLDAIAFCIKMPRASHAVHSYQVSAVPSGAYMSPPAWTLHYQVRCPGSSPGHDPHLASPTLPGGCQNGKVLTKIVGVGEDVRDHARVCVLLTLIHVCILCRHGPR